MAVCLESSSSYKIVSNHGQKPNKSLFLVKLTDSCLKTLDQLQNPTVKPKVSFVYTMLFIFVILSLGHVLVIDSAFQFN